MGRYGRGISSSAAVGGKKDGENGGASTMMSSGNPLAHTTQLMNQFSTIR